MVRSLYPVSMITGLIQHRSALTSGIAGRISAVRDLHDPELYAGLIFMALDVNVRKTIYLNLIIQVFTHFSAV